MTAPGVLSLRGVEIRLDQRCLLGPLDLDIAPGQCATVMGPSGSGKSTLLNFLAGTLDPVFEARGHVTIGTRALDQIEPEHRGIGILFQDDLLFPHLSVGGNLAFALPFAVRGKGPRRMRIDAALAEAGLSGFADRDPRTLSGGQRARVALMRTLLAEPAALLLDEPFSKLDAKLRGEFRAFVFEHARHRLLPVLMVTHDEADAKAAGGPIIELDEFTKS